MKTCNTCACDRVCDHNWHGWETCGNWIPAWISVKDRLPDEEEDVLLLVREVEYYGRYGGEKENVYRDVFTGWRIDDEWATTYCHGHRKLEEESEHYPNCEHAVTHWMPLPEPPKEAPNG